MKSFIAWDLSFSSQEALQRDISGGCLFYINDQYRKHFKKIFQAVVLFFFISMISIGSISKRYFGPLFFFISMISIGSISKRNVILW